MVLSSQTHVCILDPSPECQAFYLFYLVDAGNPKNQGAGTEQAQIQGHPQSNSPPDTGHADNSLVHFPPVPSSNYILTACPCMIHTQLLFCCRGGYGGPHRCHSDTVTSEQGHPWPPSGFDLPDPDCPAPCLAITAAVGGDGACVGTSHWAWPLESLLRITVHLLSDCPCHVPIFPGPGRSRDRSRIGGFLSLSQALRNPIKSLSCVKSKFPRPAWAGVPLGTTPPLGASYPA